MNLLSISGLSLGITGYLALALFNLILYIKLLSIR